MALSADVNLPANSVDTYLGGIDSFPDVTVEENSARETVQQGWERAQNFAESAVQGANSYLSQLRLASATLAVPLVDSHLDKINLDISKFASLMGTSPLPPSSSFNFAEIPYSSNLTTDLRARLLEWIDGKATGILPSVEQAIYNRGRAREAAASTLRAQEAVRQFASRGFPRPPGALAIELQAAAQEAQNNSITLSREVMIKQAELEQSNRRFSMEQGWKMEEQAIAYTNQQMQRALDKAKEMQQFIISTYQQRVAAYGVNSQVYNALIVAETTAFKANTDQNVAEANVRIEAAKANVQNMIQGVTLYVEAVKAGAMVSAQLAASALSSLNMSAGISDSVGRTASVQSSHSSSNTAGFTVGFDANYNYTI